MLIDLSLLVSRYDLDVHGVLHVGAHLGEEAPQYGLLGVPVWWVEGNREVIPQLVENLASWPNQHIIVALVTDQDDSDIEFHVTNYDGMSSSIFEFDRHPLYSPDTVFVSHRTLPTTTIDSLVARHGVERVNLLCLDIQGAELLALRGATKLLPQLDFVYTEVSTASVYKGGAQLGEIDEFLSGFERVETDLGMHGGTHGDAFYVRNR